MGHWANISIPISVSGMANKQRAGVKPIEKFDEKFIDACLMRVFCFRPKTNDAVDAKHWAEKRNSSHFSAKFGRRILRRKRDRPNTNVSALIHHFHGPPSALRRPHPATLYPHNTMSLQLLQCHARRNFVFSFSFLCLWHFVTCPSNYAVEFLISVFW